MSNSKKKWVVQKSGVVYLAGKYIGVAYLGGK